MIFCFFHISFIEEICQTVRDCTAQAANKTCIQDIFYVHNLISLAIEKQTKKKLIFSKPPYTLFF
jgi:hypothetical protein